MIIASAGMHRSGSTWLYNVLRHIYMLNNEEVYGSFIRHYDKSKKEKVHIVKTHRFDKELANNANFIFITRRDLRDIAASAIRRNLILENEKDIIRYLNNTLHKEYLPWIEKSNLEIIYESMINKKIFYIEKLINILNVKVCPLAVNNAVESLKIEKVFNPITHLHPNHITNGKVGSYKETLSKKTVNLINCEFKDYLLNWKYL